MEKLFILTRKGKVLLSVLNYFIATLATLLSFSGLASSCSNENLEPDNKEGKVLTRKLIQLNISSVETINRIKVLDIFYFNDDAMKRLDSYQRITEGIQSHVFGSSRAGKKIIVILANSSDDRYTWAKINSYYHLKKLMSELTNEIPDFPVMRGEKRINIISEVKCEIELKPIMAEIFVQSICFDLKIPELNKYVLEEPKIYLTNISGTSPFLNDSLFKPTRILNYGKLDSLYLPFFKDKDICYKELPSHVNKDITFADISLFCYPNTIEKEELGAPYTRLVIEGKINGKTYYYPININRRGFGHIYGNEGVEAGTRYVYNLTITKLGSTDPDLPVENIGQGIKLQIKKWDEKDEQNINY